MSALGKFEIDGQKIKGRLDYKVTEIPDSNDVMITYPDGTEQRLFALPK
ncbi:hypothetical protein [Candidatus Marithrix sp. Canyon 246]|nr:hypothetical protein [Candidatus Marithrix sp. Canyon 246]